MIKKKKVFLSPLAFEMFILIQYSESFYTTILLSYLLHASYASVAYLYLCSELKIVAAKYAILLAITLFRLFLFQLAIIL